MYHDGDIKFKSAEGENLISHNVSVVLTKIIIIYNNKIKW